MGLKLDFKRKVRLAQKPLKSDQNGIEIFFPFQIRRGTSVPVKIRPKWD